MAEVILETPRFPDTISYGSSGGPGFSTDVITVSSGYETRNVNWIQARHTYDVAFGIRSQAYLNDLVEFFQTMKGKAYGFRYKDWGDYTSSGSDTVTLIDQIIGTGESVIGNPIEDIPGSITGDIVQRTIFSDSTRSEPEGYFEGLTILFLITNGGVNNGKAATITDYDHLTGTFTIDADNLDADLTIGDTYEIARTHTKDFQLVKNYTQGSQITVRDISKPVGTGLGDSTILIGVDGVLKTEHTHYTIDYTTGMVTFINNNVPLIGEAITAGYEFDVPCRFDTDELTINLEMYDHGTVSVPLVELRI